MSAPSTAESPADRRYLSAAERARQAAQRRDKLLAWLHGHVLPDDAAPRPLPSLAVLARMLGLAYSQIHVALDGLEAAGQIRRAGRPSKGCPFQLTRLANGLLLLRAEMPPAAEPLEPEPKPAPPVSRLCLCCRRPFQSAGIHNRMCMVCRGYAASLSPLAPIETGRQRHYAPRAGSDGAGSSGGEGRR